MRSERQRAREAVAAHHEARLCELIAHVGEAIDRLRDGELDAFDVDHVASQYSRAAKELWKFCNMTDAESPHAMCANICLTGPSHVTANTPAHQR